MTNLRKLPMLIFVVGALVSLRGILAQRKNELR